MPIAVQLYADPRALALMERQAKALEGIATAISSGGVSLSEEDREALVAAASSITGSNAALADTVARNTPKGDSP